MNAPSGVVTTSITTLPSSPAAPADEGVPAEQTPEGSAVETAAPPVETQESKPESEVEKEPEQHLELAKRFEQVSKRESAVRKLEAKLQEQLASNTTLQKELSDLKSKLEAALSDPVKHYLDNGGDPVAIAKRFAQPETEEQRELKALKQRIEAKEKADAEREALERKRHEEAAHEHARFEALREFVSEITPANSPNLTTVYEASEVPALVDALLSRPTPVEMPDGSVRKMPLLRAFELEHGRRPTNEEIRNALEHEAAPRAKRILEAHTKSSSTAPQPTETAQQGPSGISNQHAAVTSSGKPRKPSLEERRKAARQEIVTGLTTGEPD